MSYDVSARRVPVLRGVGRGRRGRVAAELSSSRPEKVLDLDISFSSSPTPTPPHLPLQFWYSAASGLATIP